MIDKNKKFKFYDRCIPVKGYNQGVIYDLHRGDLFYVPNLLLEILEKNSKNKLIVIYDNYPEDEQVIDKYINYLLENELIFLTENLENFPLIDCELKKPFILDILFMEVDNLSKNKIDVLCNINNFGCDQVVLIISQKSNYIKLEECVKFLENSRVKKISIISKYSLTDINWYINLQSSFPRVHDITLVQSEIKKMESCGSIIFFQGNIDDLLMKRISSINDFLLNQEAFFESLNSNLFYNRKIYINNNCEVKHYFNDPIIYGNLKDGLESIITSPIFQRLWRVTKDQIEGCKECEFRYICPDNRMPKLKNENTSPFLYTHESKCNYDYKNSVWK